MLSTASLQIYVLLPSGMHLTIYLEIPSLAFQGNAFANSSGLGNAIIISSEIPPIYFTLIIL